MNMDDNENMVQGRRGSSQIGDNCSTAEHPAMPIFREYCQTKSEFDRVCRELAENQKHKADAEKRLLELSSKIQAMVEDGQYDPTSPRPKGDPLEKATSTAYTGGHSRY